MGVVMMMAAVAGLGGEGGRIIGKEGRSKKAAVVADMPVCRQSHREHVWERERESDEAAAAAAVPATDDRRGGGGEVW